MTEPFRVRLLDEDVSIYDYVTTLSFEDDGSLLLITEHLRREQFQVTWIEKPHLQKFLISLGLSLNESPSEEERRRALKQIKRRLKSKKEFKSWLNKHNIKSRFGSWSERY
jgi:hypothetical protein